MKLTTYAQSLHDLNLLKDQGLTEVILGHCQFSRLGRLTDDEYRCMSDRARELKLKVVFEWDILMTEEVFSQVISQLPQWSASFDSLRVQDPGALEWAIKNTKVPLQFIAENGNHNLEALKGWSNHAGTRLERLILSIELPKTTIEEYVRLLDVPCELLGLGRILLFYTPRNLLSPLVEKIPLNGELSALGESEESPHKGFPIVENRHGTFMFHIKEFCLLEYLNELRTMGLSFFRVDLRWEGLTHLLPINDLFRTYATERFIEFKMTYPQDLMRGFYLVNKTDVLFPKLKNHRLQKREGDYLGEVLDAEKGSHLAIMVKNPLGLKKSERLKIVHPKGETFEVEVRSLRDASLQEVDHVAAQKLALIPYLGGVWVKSQVFYY